MNSIPGRKQFPDLPQILNHEPCLNCGSKGFDQGDTIPDPRGWVAIQARCRSCGFVIEKRRFQS